MRRWLAKIDYLTAAKGLRHWEGEVDAATAEEATDRAMQEFKLSRPGMLKLPEIADVRLRRVKAYH
jgi:hypothetical protein